MCKTDNGNPANVCTKKFFISPSTNLSQEFAQIIPNTVRYRHAEKPPTSLIKQLHQTFLLTEHYSDFLENKEKSKAPENALIFGHIFWTMAHTGTDLVVMILSQASGFNKQSNKQLPPHLSR